jgi:hypothetical protein
MLFMYFVSILLILFARKFIYNSVKFHIYECLYVSLLFLLYYEKCINFNYYLCY